MISLFTHATPPPEEKEGTPEKMLSYVKNTLSCSCNHDISASLHVHVHPATTILVHPCSPRSFASCNRDISASLHVTREGLGHSLLFDYVKNALRSTL